MTNEKMTKSEWLKINGFSADGVTYIVMGNSYKIKEDLKLSDFKFSPLLRWHGESNTFSLPKNCSEILLKSNIDHRHTHESNWHCQAPIFPWMQN